MKGGIEAEIDRLYQIPLEEFTAARNALAKEAGSRAAEIRALTKPPLAAWAVNQLHWNRRQVYDALMSAAESLRRAHAAVLAGRAGDVRTAAKEHDERVSAALDAALDVLRQAGHPTTDATRHAIQTTLRALPADEPAGRLTRTLQPGGFEALAGLSIRGAKAPAILKPPPKPAARAAPAPGPKKSARDTKALARARESLASATRALKAAEHTAQREEFERVRAAREEEKATKAVAAARQAVEEAEEELRSAEAEATAAGKKKDSAERRVREAEAAVDRAQAAVHAAQKDIDSLDG